MSIEAMKQVLVFLEHLTTHSWTLQDQNKAIELQRQAIEQAQKQEQQHPMMDMPHDQKILHAYGYHKPQRQPLTDEQIKDVFGVGYVAKEFVEFARAIEAAHGIKEKNT